MNKLKLLLLSAFVTLTLGARSQNSNCLYFDNIDDKVTVPNGSSLIANSSGMSLSFWVYPENTAPGFPDFDGFAGIRDNNVADFYILQLTTTDVEARFRNSNGIAYDIVYSGLVLNTWQHFVLTYDGTTLNLYNNGNLVGTLPATGTISNAAAAFNIGNLEYQGTNFLTNGKLDEVSLWSIALTPAQITCIYNGAINPTDTGLELYYRFNQGVAGGNNATVTTLIDAAGNINGTLSGFALNGTTSNWIGGVTTANSALISDVICPGTTYTFGTQTLTGPGTYYEGYSTGSGCDSVVELVLTAPAINTIVGQVGPVLTAQQSGATYQWIDCQNANAPIPGAINQTYTATVNGQYAAVITLGGCSDTSVCINVVNVGINEIAASNISVAPNPFNDQITITNNSNFAELNVIVYDAIGKKIYSALLNKKEENKINTSSFKNGTYWIVVTETGQRMMIVKN